MLGNESPLRKGRAEFCLALDYAQIGNGCDSKAESGAGAVDGGNDGFAHGHHIGVRNAEILAQLGITRICLQMRQVVLGLSAATAHGVQGVHVHAWTKTSASAG